MLPHAQSDDESIVLLLDWYKGHLTQEVADAVHSKGHVLLFHGGGCTPFTQTNDTHLHARLQSMIVRLEVSLAHEVRHESYCEGRNETPKLKRGDIMNLVETVWSGLPHEEIAKRAYQQTGPDMAMQGKVAPHDVQKDLLHVLEQIEESSDPNAVGMKWRDKCIADVQDLWDKEIITGWGDYHQLIDEHDGDDAGLEEGMEAFQFDPDEHDDGPDGADDDDEGADDEDGDGGGGGGGGGGLPDIAVGDNSHIPYLIDNVSEDEGSQPADAEQDDEPPSSAVGSSTVDASYASNGQFEDALQVVQKHAVDHKDDVLLRIVRQRISQQKNAKKVSSTDIGIALHKRHQDQQDEDNKRRREAIIDSRNQDKDMAQMKVQKATQEAEAQKFKLKLLETQIVIEREREARKHTDIVNRHYQRWLQTHFAVELAHWCIQNTDARTAPERRL